MFEFRDEVNRAVEAPINDINPRSTMNQRFDYVLVAPNSAFRQISFSYVDHGRAASQQSAKRTLRPLKQSCRFCLGSWGLLVNADIPRQLRRMIRTCVTVGVNMHSAWHDVTYRLHRYFCTR